LVFEICNSRVAVAVVYGEAAAAVGEVRGAGIAGTAAFLELDAAVSVGEERILSG